MPTVRDRSTLPTPATRASLVKFLASTRGHHPHRVQLLLDPHPGPLQPLDHIGKLAQVRVSHGNLDLFISHWGDSLRRDHQRVAAMLPGSVLIPARQALGPDMMRGDSDDAQGVHTAIPVRHPGDEPSSGAPGPARHPHPAPADPIDGSSEAAASPAHRQPSLSSPRRATPQCPQRVASPCSSR